MGPRLRGELNKGEGQAGERAGINGSGGDARKVGKKGKGLVMVAGDEYGVGGGGVDMDSIIE